MFGLGTSPTNAVTQLSADHRKVDALFRELENESNPRRKAELATDICNELTVHALAEEDVFYPEALASFERERDATLVWEATIEHGTLEGLIAALTGVQAEDPTFEAHMKVLKEYVKHHVREEENEIFPAVRRTGLDLDAVGLRIAVRKRELREQMGLPPDPDAPQEAEDEGSRKRSRKPA